MTRALVTQMLEALEYVVDQGGGPLCEHEAGICFCKENTAITAAREYLATEPIGDRAELIAGIRHELAEFAHNKVLETLLLDAADMLEADARPKQVTCQIYGHVVGACVECNTHIEAQQVKRVPLTDEEIESACRWIEPGFDGPIAYDLLIARAIEAHHGITPADKPTGWDNGLSQDYCAEFGQWLASRPGARQQIREMFERGTA